MKPKFECPICHEPKFKKELFPQSINLIIKKRDFTETRRYKRITCAKCSKTKWVSKEGFIIKEGE
jgi:uncharacterized protein (DUF2225 family)